MYMEKEFSDPPPPATMEMGFGQVQESTKYGQNETKMAKW